MTTEPKALAKQIGDRVHEHRVRRRPRDDQLTQIQLGKLTGIHQTKISKIEAGDFDVSIILQLRGLAEYFGITFDELVFGAASNGDTRAGKTHRHEKAPGMTKTKPVRRRRKSSGG